MFNLTDLLDQLGAHFSLGVIACIEFLAAALLVASGGVLLLLLMAESVEKVLHRTGIAVLSKLTGLLLSAIAAQVIFTGIQSFLG